jgi:hypothetical protein
VGVSERTTKLSTTRESGFALIVLLALLTAGVLYVVVAQLDVATVQRERDKATNKALAEAKEALVGRAVTDDNRPGSMPCPDIAGNGTSASLVGNNCPSYVGRLPWRTLGIPDLRDASGERLWYALSSSLRDDNSAQPINSNTVMTLALDGIGVAAIVIAPGSILNGQSRPSNIVTDYLDGANADGDTAYVSQTASGIFNDHLLSIGQQEIFSAVAKRVASEMRGDTSNGLQRFFQNNGSSLPMAADLPLGSQGIHSVGYIPYGDAGILYPGSPWLNNNGWFFLVGYQRNASNRATLTLGTNSHVFTF